MSYYSRSNFGGDGDDYDEEEDRETEFGIHTYKSTARKNEKKTFWCTLCGVELNSIETRQSHNEGRKHRDRVSEEARRRRIPEHEVDEYAIEQINNPDAIKKKTIERLEVKIRKTNDPVVGLKYIDEFLPESNDEMEPYYKCVICHKKGEGNAMLNHLVGREHRGNFFKNPEMASWKLREIAERNRENEKGHRIVTHVSDAEYPWPAGKEPWSIEQGGDGVPPADKNLHDDRKFVTDLPDVTEAIQSINAHNAGAALDYVFAAVDKLRARLRSLRNPDALEDIERALFCMESAANIIKAKIKKEHVKTEEF